MKHRIIAIALTLCLLLGMIPAVCAEETVTAKYDAATGMLCLMQYDGTAANALAAANGNPIKGLVVEGACRVTGELSLGTAAVILLTDASLTVTNETGACLDLDDGMVLMAEQSTLELQSKAEEAAALQAQNLYTGGSGALKVTGGMTVEDTATMQQTENVEIVGAVTVENLVLPPTTKQQVTTTEEGAEKLVLAPSDTVGTTQAVKEVDGETVPCVVMEAPESAAVRAKTAILACYDESGQMLAVAEGTYANGQWTFEDPGVQGEWRVFFGGNDFAPLCESYTIDAPEPAEEPVLSLDLMLTQTVSGTEEIITPAIRLVKALGIMNYYQDGIFGVGNPVTREEAARIITRLSNAGTDVSAEYQDACTLDDVEPDRWSVGDIGYCQSVGYISHMIEHNRYNPMGNITVDAFAGMLMAVLGYDVDLFEFRKPAKALKEAEWLGLLRDVADNGNLNRPITRGEMAQMIMNVLRTPAVAGITCIPMQDVAQKMPKTADAFLKDTETIELVHGMLGKLGHSCVIRSGELYAALQDSRRLCELLYQQRLVYSGEQDTWGRPGESFTLYDRNQIRFAHLEQKGELLVTTHQPLDLGVTLNAYLTEGYQGKLVLNGSQIGNVETLTADLTEAWSSRTGNGVQTEVYVDMQSKMVTVVIIDTWLVEVIKVDDDKATLMRTDGKYMGATKSFGYQIGDHFLAREDNYGVLLMQPAELQQARVMRVSQSSGAESVTLDDASYQLHDDFRTDLTSLVGKYVLYALDLYGYVIHVEPVPLKVGWFSGELETASERDETGALITGQRYRLVGFDGGGLSSIPVDTGIADEISKSGNLIEYRLDAEGNACFQRAGTRTDSIIVDSDVVLLENKPWNPSDDVRVLLVWPTTTGSAYQFVQLEEVQDLMKNYGIQEASGAYLNASDGTVSHLVISVEASMEDGNDDEDVPDISNPVF